MMRKILKWSAQVIGALITLIIVFLVIVDLSFGGFFLRPVVSFFHISDTYRAEVSVKGNLEGYPVDITEVVQCESEIFKDPVIGKEFWLMENPYFFQLNDDGSVIVIHLNSLRVCDQKIGKTLTVSSMVKEAFWFSSKEEPEEIKKINWSGDLRRFNVSVSPVSDSTDRTQRYKITWVDSIGKKREKNIFSFSKRANYILLPVFSIYEYPDWKKIPEFSKTIGNATDANSYIVKLSKKSVNVLHQMFSQRKCFETNGNVLIARDCPDAWKNSTYIKVNNFVRKDEGDTVDNPFPNIEYTYQVNQTELLFPDNKACEKRSFYAFLFPHDNAVGITSSCTTNVTFPMSSIFKEIK